MEKSYSKRAQEDYKNQLRKIKLKIIKGLLIISAIFASVAVVFYFFRDREITFILFLVALAIFVMCLIILFFVSLFFVSEKPLYQYLYPKVIDDHNYEEISFMTYHAYPKDKEFLNFGMLYPSRVSKKIRFQITFENRNGYQIDVYDAYLFTSNNKSTRVYLNGYYLIVRDYGSDVFQVRTKGTPYIKPKLTRLSEYLDMRVFVPENINEIDQKYIKLYNRIKEEYQSPSLVLAGNGVDLHIGVTLSPMRRSVKVLNDETYTTLRRSLVQLVDLANTIES